MKRRTNAYKGTLDAEGRDALRKLGMIELELSDDYARRFRNALRVIATCDPRWMIWVEDNLPRRLNYNRCALQLIESRARALTLRSYARLFSKSQAVTILFCESNYFDERGVMVAR